MKLHILYEDRLKAGQLDKIIADIKPMLKEITVPAAIWRQMRRYKYGNSRQIFKIGRASCRERV